MELSEAVGAAQNCTVQVLSSAIVSTAVPEVLGCINTALDAFNATLNQSLSVFVSLIQDKLGDATPFSPSPPPFPETPTKTTGDEYTQRQLSEPTCFSDVQELSLAARACAAHVTSSPEFAEATKNLTAAFCAHTFNLTETEASVDAFVAAVEDELASLNASLTPPQPRLPPSPSNSSNSTGDEHSVGEDDTNSWGGFLLSHAAAQSSYLNLIVRLKSLAAYVAEVLGDTTVIAQVAAALAASDIPGAAAALRESLCMTER